MTSQIQAKQTYDRHYVEAEAFLSQYPDDLSKNQAITHFYQ